MVGHGSLPGFGVCYASLQLLDAKLKGGDIAGIVVSGRETGWLVMDPLPPLLASRKLVVCGRAGILTTGLFTGRASRQLAIALNGKMLEVNDKDRVPTRCAAYAPTCAGGQRLGKAALHGHGHSP